MLDVTLTWTQALRGSAWGRDGAQGEGQAEAAVS